MSQRLPLRPRDIELIEMPTIASQMPVEFENGQTWQDFEGRCAGCGEDITSGFMRGAVIRQALRCYTVEAVGVCASCRSGTSFLVRLHDDGSLTTQVDGVWHRTARGQQGLFSWLGSLLRSLFGTSPR